MAVARVAQHVFQIERIAVAEAEVIASAHGAVKMNGELQLSRLVDQHAENVILERAIVVFGGHAAGAELGVNGFGFLARRIAEEEGAEVSGFKVHGHAALFLVVSDRSASEGFRS